METIKLISLPFAGGSKYSYEPFRKHLSPFFSLTPIDYPGRGDRLGENSLSDIRLLAADALAQVKAYIQHSEYIIYGHSMGSLVGYELTKEIVRRGYRSPSLLFVTGHGAPSVRHTLQTSTYPSGKFWDEVKSFGGLPNEILDHKELRELFEPILRSDFRAIESYVYTPLQQPLGIPIHVVAGTEETDISDEDLAAWQNETTMKLRCERMPGNHFFIFEKVAELMRYFK